MWFDCRISRLFLRSGFPFLLDLPASILGSAPSGGIPEDKTLSLRIEEIGRTLAREEYAEGLELANELSLEVSRRSITNRSYGSEE